MEYARDYVMYASIFGMFSFSWFGWAQENPRASWRKYLGIASGIALLVCLFGVFLSIRNWDAPSALSASTSFRQYLISVYAEIFLAGAGAGWLILQKRKDFIAPWIAFIVGIPFISLAGVFEDPSLYLLAAAGGSVSCFSLFFPQAAGCEQRHYRHRRRYGFVRLCFIGLDSVCARLAIRWRRGAWQRPVAVCHASRGLLGSVLFAGIQSSMCVFWLLSFAPFAGIP
ncbi:hypothetical protein [Cohnella zeiphila]|uniref:hypothetical protein n=1 Tax=Cohnella zeiphila TaxID=2761120 RepID=UPI001EE381AF|nr:hypothetical protein [Cohnella zeiphila]